MKDHRNPLNQAEKASTKGSANGLQVYHTKRYDNNIEINLVLIDTPGYSEVSLKDWYELVKDTATSRVSQVLTQFDQAALKQAEITKKKLNGEFDADSDDITEQTVACKLNSRFS